MNLMTNDVTKGSWLRLLDLLKEVGPDYANLAQAWVFNHSHDNLMEEMNRLKGKHFNTMRI